MTNQRAICLLSQMYLPCFDEEEKEALSLAINTLSVKEQEPLVLTLEEVKAAKGSTVWLERSFGIGYETAIAPIEITGIGTGGISFYFGNEDYRAYGHPVYGWRCWTSKPTDEQRKKTPWEGR